MKTVILDGFAINPGDMSWDFLSRFGEYVVYDRSSPEEVAERIGDAEIVVTNRMRIDRDILAACPKLRFVSAFGTGYDMIDVKACRERGIEVCNIPGYSTTAVAQFAFTLLLSLSTDIPAYRKAVRDGFWTGMPSFNYPAIPYTELLGKTVGIYGCGAIGGQFAKLCSAFGMKVLAYRRSVTPKVIDGITYVDRDTLLKEADFLSLHCPLTPETESLVNRDFLAKMKKGAYLINTSRGAVIDEEALYKALTDGHLRGAALDVMRQEPPSADNPLLTLDNCIITPHAAWVCIEARERLVSILCDNIDAFLRTGQGIHRVF